MSLKTPGCGGWDLDGEGGDTPSDKISNNCLCIVAPNA